MLLIEVLVSILLFSFALLGLVAMQARAIQFSAEAEDRNRAALLANELVSTMWAQQTANKSNLSAQISAWQTRVKAALPPHGDQVTATVSDPDSNGVVTIRLGWAPVAGASSATSGHSYMTQVVIP